MENTATWLKLAAHARAIANEMRDSRDEQTMREIASSTSFWRCGLAATRQRRRNRKVGRVPRAFAPPATDQAEEQARFVVMQHLNANAIGHTTLLRMRDCCWSWSAILRWINARPRRSGAVPLSPAE